jgi:hypothetical protein
VRLLNGVSLCLRANPAKARGAKLKEPKSVSPERWTRYGSQLPEVKMRKYRKYIKTTEEPVKRLRRGISIFIGGGL